MDVEIRIGIDKHDKKIFSGPKGKIILIQLVTSGLAKLLPELLTSISENSKEHYLGPMEEYETYGSGFLTVDGDDETQMTKAENKVVESTTIPDDLSELFEKETTKDEIAKQLAELEKEGMIQNSGKTRPGKDGNPEIVWELTNYGQKIANGESENK